jgi:hypothetical protein
MLDLLYGKNYKKAYTELKRTFAAIIALNLDIQNSDLPFIKKDSNPN